MLKKSRYCFLVSILALFISCSYIHTEINSEVDKKEGKIFVEDIFDKIMLYHDNQFILTLATGDKQKLDALLKDVKIKMGTMISYNITSVETKKVIKNGFFTTISYLIKLHVTYKKGSSEEAMALIKKGEKDKILINGYNVNSDQILK